MKFIAVAVSALVFLAPSVLAGPSPPVNRAPASSKLVLVESGIVPTANMNFTESEFEKRTGPEVVTCYTFGTKVPPDDIYGAAQDWCNIVAIGTYVPKGQTLFARFQGNSITVLVSATARTECNGFTIDNNCERLLRLPVDQCPKAGGTTYGGYETDSCGIWRSDPGSNGSDV